MGKPGGIGGLDAQFRWQMETARGEVCFCERAVRIDALSPNAEGQRRSFRTLTLALLVRGFICLRRDDPVVTCIAIGP